MSFRKKHKKSEEEDVKVAYEKGSQQAKKPSAQEQSSEQQASQQTGQQSGQQTGQESGQPSDQESEEKDDEQQPTDDEEDEDAEPVPDGTTAEILQWVGDDTSRAQRALDKEQDEDKPRAGLTGELKKLLEE